MEQAVEPVRSAQTGERRASVTIHAQPTLPEGGKARRVYLLLREEISNGTHSEGALLPGENRLAEEFGVSRVTIRRALDALLADGLIKKRVGAGSIVLPLKAQDTQIAADFAGLIPQLVEIDRVTTARLLSFSYGVPPEGVATALSLRGGDTVQTAVRVRSSDGTPFSHLTTHVPEDIAQSYDEADLATQPLFRLLERSGVVVHSATQTVSATMATPDVSKVLDVSVGAPLLSLRRIVQDDNGRGVEYLSALYRPDMFRLEMTLARIGAGDNRHWEPVIGDSA